MLGPLVFLETAQTNVRESGNIGQVSERERSSDVDFTLASLPANTNLKAIVTKALFSILNAFVFGPEIRYFRWDGLARCRKGQRQTQERRVIIEPGRPFSPADNLNSWAELCQ